MKLVKKIVLAVFILAALVLFYIGEIAPYKSDSGTPLDRAAEAGEDTETVSEYTRGPEYVITYMSEGREYYSEKVQEGSLPKEELTPADCNFLGWKNEAGEYVDVAATPVTADATYTAVIGPALKDNPTGFFPCDTDGLFYPEREIVRSELAEIIYNLLAELPDATVTMNDVKAEADYRQAAAAVVSAGYMEMSGENFRPNVAVTSQELEDALAGIFNVTKVKDKLSTLGETVSRGDTAMLIHSLINVTEVPEGSFEAYYPDVPQSLECYEAVSLCGEVSEVWAPAGEKHAAGFFNAEGYLYCIDENGYLKRDTTEGTLTFGSDYRFTSGNTELDDFVAQRIEAIEKENPGAEREELLRKAYEFVRDTNLYQRGKHYEVGETGWEIEEALKLFNKKLGNCYSFAAQFWALARGLGYDAKIYSGMISHTYQSHGWVEIDFDGEPYVFDVEQEGIYYRQGHQDYSTSMYKMDYERAALWSYIRNPEDVPEEAKEQSSEEEETE